MDTRKVFTKVNVYFFYNKYICLNMDMKFLED